MKEALITGGILVTLYFIAVTAASLWAAWKDDDANWPD